MAIDHSWLTALDASELALVIVAAVGALLACDASHDTGVRRLAGSVAVGAVAWLALSLATDVDPALVLLGVAALGAIATTARWLARVLGLRSPLQPASRTRIAAISPGRA